MSCKTVLLNNSHNKKDFTCGKQPLDDYLQRQASQDVKRNLSACFILPDLHNQIKGYYTLSSASIPQSELSAEIQAKLPKSYAVLPATLIGRLAVNTRYKGQRLGEFLLMDALYRSYDVSQKSIGSLAVIVDPLDNEAVNFYTKYGFLSLPDSGKMFLPMKTIVSLFS